MRSTITRAAATAALALLGALVPAGAAMAGSGGGEGPTPVPTVPGGPPPVVKDGRAITVTVNNYLVWPDNCGLKFARQTITNGIGSAPADLNAGGSFVFKAANPSLPFSGDVVYYVICFNGWGVDEMNVAWQQLAGGAMSTSAYGLSGYAKFETKTTRNRDGSTAFEVTAK
ncbi:hypothetical protein [Dactylosporangium sp. CA-139066]|uniref:hypothetical protein n=1 Tax=Dactylosporangium sp. CA-139066 TaxID=3239930 RepID=UPI003D92290E